MSEQFVFPASFAQERLWFLDRLEPASGRYNLGWALALHGPLDAAALHRAFAVLVARHEALRTTFGEEDGRPLQVVSSERAVELPRVDLRGLPDAPRRDELLRLAADELRRPFDLAHGPLLRHVLVQLAPGEHALLLALHHIVSDAWSFDVLRRELAQLYENLAVDLSPLPLQYGDYAVWQRDWLQGEVLAAKLAFWRGRLAGLPPALDLPIDRTRPAVQTSRGRNHRITLSARLAADLRRLGRAERCTPFMVLLAGFAALLARLTGQHDLAVGSAVANRDQVELEGVIGLFANTVVLRTDLTGNPTVRELLGRVRVATLAAAGQGDLPFERLVEELRPERDLSRTPLVQVIFDLRPAGGTLALPGVAAAPLPVETGTAKLDLTLSLEEGPDGVAGVLQWNTDLFEAATIARLVGQWRILLTAMALDGDRRLSELPLLSPAERHQALVEAQGADVPGGLPAATVPGCFAAAVARWPTRTAVTCEGASLTYGELAGRVDELAHRLRALGAGPDVPVGVALDRSLDLVVAVLAVLAAGGAYVPLDPAYPEERLAFLRTDSGARLVVGRGEAGRRIAGDAVLLDPGELVPLNVGAGLAPSRAGASPAPTSRSRGGEDFSLAPAVEPSHLAYVIYTSGSTGRPKGVAVTHGNVVRLFDTARALCGFGEDDVWTLFHSYAFDFSVWEIFGALLHGGRLVVVPYAVSRSPEDVHRLLRRERVTVLNQTPSAFFQLARVDAELAAELPDLRLVLFGGEALTTAGLARWFADHGDHQPRLVNLFGITETTVHVTWRPLAASDAVETAVETNRGGSPIGVPLPDLEVYLVDAAHQPVPLGVPGELWVAGPGLARGYLGRPDLTAERFVPHPWSDVANTPGARCYRSGDLARRLPNGDLDFLGRADRQVKVRGFRIEPAEIEAALLRHPAVAQAVVVLADRGTDDRRLVAYAVPDRRHAAPALELLRLEQEGATAGRTLRELENGLTVFAAGRSETEFLDREIFAAASYLRHGVTLPPAACVFDVGANVGLFALFAASRSPGATVYAFEPIPPLFELLALNARLYGFDGHLFGCGVAEREGSATFTYYPHLTVLSGRFADAAEEAGTVRAYLDNLGEETADLSDDALAGLVAERLSAQTFACPLTTLSAVIRARGVERIDLLKVDVEKGELEVLAGIADEDWPKIHQVVVEVHDHGGRLRTVEDLLAARGFRVVAEQDADLAGTALYNLFAVRWEAPAEGTTAEPPLPEAWTWSSPERWRADLRSALRAALPEHMVPAALVALPELPLTAHGKLDHRALPSPTAQVNPAPAPALTTPSTPRAGLEAAIAAIWRDVLGIDPSAPLGTDDNFFDLGGHSLLLARVHGRLRSLLPPGRPLSMVDLFRHPTIAALAAHLEPAPAAAAEPTAPPPARADRPGTSAVAIVGWSGRFPGADSIDALWANLAAGVESITFFTADEMAADGAPSANRPGAVAARGMLADADLFDAAFFGLTAREADVLDPQQRLLLEHAWAALDDAGYPPGAPGARPERTAVFAGIGRNTWLRRIEARPDILESVGELAATMANQHDFATTRVSYKLGLQGPSVNVQTACSTSLVAVHLACRALLAGDCDLALAGGAAVKFPQRASYLATEGGIVSPDGRCRPYDAAATGTVPGEGVALVVLKRLADALADGDTVHAVIRGTAINNDGADKVGFAAPGVAGQAAAIAAAQATASVRPEEVTCIEGHGTGTPLGDPIEVAALAQAFGPCDGRRGFCALGSVKGNLGHLDAAAGVTGLIKLALALEHRQIPPSLHLERPNPEIDFAATPFRPVVALTDWDSGDHLRIGGVSAFGIGGTNAHAVLQEAPTPPPPAPSRAYQLLVLSARTPAALETAAARLHGHLERYPEIDFADVAHTLAVGRRPFPHRRAVVAAGREEAIAALAAASDRTGTAAGERPVVFLFPGQGAQRPGATAELYREEPGYRERIDRCAAILRPFGLDLPALLFPPPGDEEKAEKAAANLRRTEVAQPCLFAVEWSLAGLWSDWGVVPEALLGHSLGQYVAACLAGVFPLETALALVAERGRLMGRLPGGAMLAVPLGEAAVRARLAGEEIALAAVNGPERCVVSGSSTAIERFAGRLAADGIAGRPLATSHAFHSAAMDPLLEPLARLVQEAAPAPPRLPYLSNLTGTWIRPEEATDPAAWAAHLRRTVRFDANLRELLADPARLVLEIGPGGTLAALARRVHPGGSGVFSPLAAEEGSEQARMLDAFGGLWCAGARVDWAGLRRGERRRRVPLPTTPFERRRHWIAPPAIEHQAVAVPTPERAPMPAPNPIATPDRSARLLAAVREIFGNLVGAPPATLAADATFLELGADSLSLIQASRALEARFGLRIPFRRLLEDLSTSTRLAGHLASSLPPEQEPVAPPPVVAMTPVAVPTASTGIEEIAREHLRVMSRLLDLMGAGSAATSQDPRPLAGSAGFQPAASLDSKESRLEAGAPSTGSPPVYVPYQPVRTAPAEGLEDAAERHVADLVARLNARTPGSKRLAAEHRPAMADPRAVSGFRLQWKEMVYPIAARSAAGGHFWDVDGNEYVDLNMGFGVHLFGHAPDFITAAVRAELDAGLGLGPRAALAGEVARGVCELTGMERAAFCVSGTEAVMTALRVVRTVTRRSRVVVFAGSYHGAYDGTLAKAGAVGAGGSPRPIAPGILPGMVEDLLVLDYGAPESLDRIAAAAGTLAAVLVEPVQSRRPDLQPAAFLRDLRQLTRERGIALIFDEIVTGFRLHPAGAGGLFGVQPDLAAYGKVLGGGLPIGILAGRAEYVDALDGGAWRFGDASVPEAELTFFASTFAQHPLALAAARAVLDRLRAEGPALQERLGARTAHLAARLDAEFAAAGLPLTTAVCGSIFRFLSLHPVSHLELLYFHLAEKGVYAGYGRPAFLSTAHTDDDLEIVVDAVRRSARELAAAGLLGGRPAAVAVPASATVPEPPRTLPTLPLTAAQEQLWVLSQLESEAAAAYNQPLLVALHGPLDAGAIAAAVQATVDRHEALRITFDPDGARQTIHPELRLVLDLTDATVWGDEERAAREAAWREAAAREPFDLVAGPLLRARLLRRGPEDHLLALTVHHIVSDGRSMGVVLREIAALYAAACDPMGGRLVDLPQPAGFGRYVTWQREIAAGPEGQAAERYWRELYADPPSPLDLPADLPRPALSFATAALKVDLDPAAWQAARAAGARRGATPLALLLAAWAVVLHRLSGQGDFTVGVPAAGQLTMGEPELVGYCVELLPLRLRLDGDAPFSAHLATAGRGLLDAREHHAYPFGALLQALKLPRTAGRPPLVQTTFNLDRVGGLTLPGLTAEVLAGTSGASDFELDLNLVNSGAGLLAHCEFRTALFEPATVRRWLGHLENVLRAVAGDADLPMAAIPLLGEAERRQLLVDWNDTAAPRPAGVGIHHLVAAVARRTPDAVAVAGPVRGTARGITSALTYGELERRSQRLAGALRRRGVGAEVPVGVLLPHSPEAVIAFLGIVTAGGAYLPLEAENPGERLAWTLADAGAPLVLTTRALAGRLSLPPGVTALNIEDLGIEDLGIGSDSAEASGEVPFAGDSSLAYILYTSGSTGRPKGVMVPHDALVDDALSMGAWYGLTAADRMLQLASLAFDLATEEIFAPLAAGATVVLRPGAEPPTPAELTDLIADHCVTVISTSSSYWHAWADELIRGAIPPPPPHLRQVTTGMEQMSAERLAPWRAAAGDHVQLLSGYGLTEATISSTMMEVAAPPVSIGRPIANARCYVLDARGEPVPIGAAGELCVGGVGVARGYLGAPAVTAARFVPDPFGGEPGARLLRTGDLARWRSRCDSDPEIEHLGRIDRQLRIRGHRVGPEEVEVALDAHPEVAATAVAVRPDAAGGARLVAWVVPRPAPETAPTALTPADLRAFLAARLPAAIVPAAFVLLDRLPLLPNGKVNLHALPAPPVELAAEDREPPATPTEREVAAAWREVLGVEPAAGDDFFALGGHSLKAVQVLSRLRTGFGIDLRLRDFFAAPTVRALADRVEEALLEAEAEAADVLLDQLEITGHV